VCGWLVAATGVKLAPGISVSVIALLALVGLAGLLPETAPPVSPAGADR
jgi:hypothetical protein